MKNDTTPTPAYITIHRTPIEMTPQESILYVQQLITRLRAKQQRERAYLNRRARRGIRTPTDEVYEADQLLENELIALLEDLMPDRRAFQVNEVQHDSGG